MLHITIESVNNRNIITNGVPNDNFVRIDSKKMVVGDYDKTANAAYFKYIGYRSYTQRASGWEAGFILSPGTSEFSIEIGVWRNYPRTAAFKKCPLVIDCSSSVPM